MSDPDLVFFLKSTLGSAMKSKLLKEGEVCQLRGHERSLTEELNYIKQENNFLIDQLQIMQQSVSKTEHQITLIDVCLASEKTKINYHNNSLQNFQEEFNQIFEKERFINNLHNIQTQEKKALKEKEKMQKRREQEAKNYQLLQEATQIENQCKEIEQECSVVKKRNAAIMLKLRRKLVETENIRKTLAKQKDTTVVDPHT